MTTTNTQPENTSPILARFAANLDAAMAEMHPDARPTFLQDVVDTLEELQQAQQLIETVSVQGSLEQVTATRFRS